MGFGAAVLFFEFNCSPAGNDTGRFDASDEDIAEARESVYPRKLQHLLIVCLSVCQSHFNIIGRKSTVLFHVVGSTLGRLCMFPDCRFP